MSMPYLTGEQPGIGDIGDLLRNSAESPRGQVVVVVGGATEDAMPSHKISDWIYLGAGVLMDIEGMGLVFDDNPSDEVALVRRQGQH